MSCITFFMSRKITLQETAIHTLVVGCSNALIQYMLDTTFLAKGSTALKAVQYVLTQVLPCFLVSAACSHLKSINGPISIESYAQPTDVLKAIAKGFALTTLCVMVSEQATGLAPNLCQKAFGLVSASVSYGMKLFYNSSPYNEELHLRRNNEYNSECNNVD
ncbi:hypothetical protein [Candidatus Cyrtobacter comes]|nr:hypothetical protein [Candidatus Cyrtobacter comes]